MAGTALGLKIVAIGMNQVTLPEEDAEMIKQASENGYFTKSVDGSSHIGRSTGRGNEDGCF